MVSRTRNNILGANLRQKQPEKHEPFPGMIDGNVWHLRDGKHPAYVMKKNGEYFMQVPMGDSDSDRRLRLHEQGHTAFSPFLDELENPPMGVEFATLNAVEDSRIAIKLEKVDPEYGEINRRVTILDDRTRRDIHNGFIAQKEALEDAGKTEPNPTPINLLEVARMIAAGKGYNEENWLHTIAAQNGFEWISNIVDDLHDQFFSTNDPTFNDTVEYAKELEKRVGQKEAQLIQKNMEENEALIEADLEHLKDQYDFHRGKTTWGKLHMKYPPLTERMPIGMKHYKNRPADQGIVPTNWHRFAMDQKIFNRRKIRRNQCGTILIDQSGSMHLSTQEMQEIISRWPGVIIAGYSGYDDRNGELRILAQNGKMIHANHLQPRGGTNVIDGPALDWLAKQQQPRIWISDGLVTGIGENQSHELLMDAAMKVKKGRITRIDNVREILGTE